MNPCIRTMTSLLVVGLDQDAHCSHRCSTFTLIRILLSKHANTKSILFGKIAVYFVPLAKMLTCGSSKYSLHGICFDTMKTAANALIFDPIQINLCPYTISTLVAERHYNLPSGCCHSIVLPEVLSNRAMKTATTLLGTCCLAIG